MILKKLLIRNYKQHAYKEIDINGNIIGIIGPNGSGKSNLLGALHFIFGGEQPGFKKSDLLRWGEHEGVAGAIFEHNGIEGRITREIHSTNATFQYGADTYSGITKIAEAIWQHLGIDKDILNSIFVRQAEIDDILFTDPRIRELTFQKLCGLGDSAKLYKRLGVILAELETPPNYDDQIAEGKQRRKQVLDRLKTIRANIAACELDRNKCPSLDEMQAKATSYDGVRSTLRHYSEIAQTVSDMASAIETTKSELGEISATIKDVDIEKLDDTLKGLRQLLQDSIEYKRRLAEFEETGKAIIDLGDGPEFMAPPFTDEQIAELDERAKKLSTEYEEAMVNVRLYDGLIEALSALPLGSGTECPVCGNTITDEKRLQYKAQEYRQTAKAVDPTAVMEELRKAKQAVLDYKSQQVKATTEYATKKAALMERYEKAESALNEARRVDDDTATIKHEIDEIENVKLKYFEASNRKTALEAKVQTNERHIEKLNDELRSLRTQIDSLADVREIIETSGFDQAVAFVKKRSADLWEAIQTAQKLDQELAQLNGMVQELENNLNAIENMLSVLEHKRTQQTVYKEAIKTVHEVRDWFHYPNGPRTLSVGVLRDMVGNINKFLSYFSAPFSVTPADTFGFNCVFHDGTPMPVEGAPDAAHLSGGQRIQLAIAFRFASYCMFANRLGILSLDEPTVYLDDRNVGCFCTLLSRIKEMAQQMHLQIFLATHERSVLPFTDTVIQLGNDQVENEELKRNADEK